METATRLSRVAVESSSVSSVGYDAAVAVLEVEFRNGSVYRYFAVPSSVHEALMRSSSKGAFVNQRVRDLFPFARV